ncbi:DUF2063 domain-containing protein [Thalassospira lucentensis]|uniref:HvfC/BufC N-terminal domain-containing protein n=1 Tax=Thalassospira lucentensis TaxID=168935 RepID=UPI00399D735E
MSNLKPFYDGFSNALFRPDPRGVPDGFPAKAAHRFAIYRNNVHRGLIDALAAAYPTVKKLVGTDFFATLARDFIASENKRPGSLALYGDEFADFIANYDAVRGIAYLADIARLERARLEALHACDTPPLAAADLAGYEADIGQMSFAAHPACRLLMSDYPVMSIWQVQNAQDGQERGKSILNQPEAVLVIRPEMSLQMQVLSPDAAAFCHAVLLDRTTLEDAVDRASKINQNFDVTQCFADLLLSGALRTISCTGEQHGR